MGVLKSALVHIKADEWIMPSISMVNEQCPLSHRFNSTLFDLIACFCKTRQHAGGSRASGGRIWNKSDAIRVEVVDL